jgi:hypothetical protein
MSEKLVALAVASLLASGTAVADKQTVWYDIDAGTLSESCLADDLATDNDALAAAMSYVNVHVDALADFEVTWHGKNGAVFKIDLAGALAQGTLTFSVSGAGAEAAAAAGVEADAVAGFPLTSRWASGGAEAVAGAGAGGIAASGAAAGSLNGMLSRVTVDAANITEFRGGLLMGGLQGSASGSFVSELAGVLTQAYAAACADTNSVFLNPPPVCDSDSSLTPTVATAAAEALAGAIGGSAVGIATVAHYKKLPGNKSTDIIKLNTGAVAILGCAAGASASSSAP